MSTARLDRLRALLTRVEQRKAQPRLRAVPSAAPQPLAVASIAKAPPPEDEELSFDTIPPAAEPATVPPAAAAPSVQPLAPQPARTPLPSRPAATSPIEEAVAQLPERVEDSGPLEVQALAEPITTPEEREEHDTEPPPPPPAFDPHVMVTHRPDAKLSLPDIELIGAPAAPTFVQAGPTFVPPSGGREPTLEFATGPKAAPRAIEVGTAEPILLQAPSATIEASLPSVAQAARAVSQVRIEAPKSFGELLELSLSLRPR